MLSGFKPILCVGVNDAFHGALVKVATARGLEVFRFESMAQVEKLIDQQVVVSVFDQGWARRLRRERVYPYFVHCGEDLPDLFIERLRSEVFGTWLPQSKVQEAVIEICERVRPSRKSQRIVPKGVTLMVGGYGPFVLDNISEKGFAFRFDAEVKAKTLTDAGYGTVLENVEFRKAGAVFLKKALCTVRSVLREGEDVRVGCTFEAGHRDTVVTNRANVEAIMRTAVLRQRLQLTMITAQGPTSVEVESMELSENKDAICFDADGTVAVDTLAVKFELENKFYSFVGTIDGQNPLRLRMPKHLEVRQMRASSRSKLDLPVWWVDPLLDERVDGTVVDFSADGFLVESPRPYLPETGLQLNVWVNDAEVAIHAVVQNERKRAGLFRMGMRTSISRELRMDLARIAAEKSVPGGTMRAISFEEKWELFEKSGYASAEMLAAKDTDPWYRNSHAALRQLPPQHFAEFSVCDEKGRVEAHLEVLRVASRCGLFFQHAADSSRALAGIQCTRMATKYVIATQELSFLTAMLSEQNRWSSKVYERFDNRFSDKKSVMQGRAIFSVQTQFEQTGDWTNKGAPPRKSDIDRLFSQQPALIRAAFDLNWQGVKKSMNSLADANEYGGRRMLLYEQVSNKTAGVLLVRAWPNIRDDRGLLHGCELWIDRSVSEATQRQVSANLFARANALFAELKIANYKVVTSKIESDLAPAPSLFHGYFSQWVLSNQLFREFGDFTLSILKTAQVEGQNVQKNRSGSEMPMATLASSHTATLALAS
jgi:hypothetical protein